MSASPLAGITVVDLSRLLPGPLAARLLADLGARVIKVEEPALGDPVRYAPPRVNGVSALAALLLAGVESVALDLKKEGGKEALLALLGEADVLLDSFRPGTLARLGLAPEELSERFPRLVCCSLSGWGQEGSHAGRAGHDLTYQALAGALAPLSGMAALPAVPVADVAGAWSAVAAILAALLERQKSGRGTRIDASLLDAAVHANLTAWAQETDGPRGVGEALPLTGELPCYNLYRTADGGWLALAALEPRFWRRFCRAAGRPDLERFHLATDPAARQAVAELVAGRTRDEWRQLVAAEDIPAEPVLSATEALAHPQMAARRVVERGEGGTFHLAFPARFDGERPRSAAAVPRLGEHTRAVLAELVTDEDRPPRRGGGRSGIGRRFSWKRLLARWVGP